ncbi:formate dehydrogenase subunit alpha [Methanobacterium alcaliphilum]|uniref:formate dehydrogenase subunit alpha n=1 Tax=Methanobacterium alcaliphilum TaxID=392018 RepID=UPI00200A6EFE|nr:formate dehydrogenase subunit alpha [Methanobacterium alcaliphilum]
MGKVSFCIDGLEVEAREGSTVLQAALENNIYIPNLCYHPLVNSRGACRMCLVESGEGRLITSCETIIHPDLKVFTETEQVKKAREWSAKLLINYHEVDCLTCAQDGDCKLQEISSFLGMEKEEICALRPSPTEIPHDESNPFFKRNLNKCILCGICVRICSEVVGASAIDFSFRGFETKISTFGDGELKDSSCVSCGECVQACPVGALLPKRSEKPAREVKTTCPYCGVGCTLYLGIRGDQVISVRADEDNHVNKGNLCVKGRYGFNFINSGDRLTKPLVKKESGLNGTESQYDGFIEVEWGDALKYIANNLFNYKGDSFGAIASGRCTNEDNYVLQKFTRAVMGTNNVDNCARSCHAPSVAALAETLGSGSMTNSTDQIIDCKCMFIIGTNPTDTYPVVGMRMVQAVENGSKLIVADPREIELSKKADIFLKINPGSDVALVMGMARYILEENLHDTEYIENRCENFEEFKQSLDAFDLQTVEEITGVEKELIMQAAKLYAESEPAAIFYSLGITEHSHGTDNVFALSNLALITGNIGKPSAGLNPLRGQNNVQGVCDMGCLPDTYPGYQKVHEKENHVKFEKAWNSKLSEEPGLKMPFMIGAYDKKQVKALYVLGENPALSEPDITNIKKSLDRMDFLIVQDMFMTETGKMADVVLPGCSYAEKDGTYTNQERRFQRIRRSIHPKGESLPDWLITSKIAQEMGESGFEFKTALDVNNEMADLSPLFSGIRYGRMEEEGLQWPCRSEKDPGTRVMHVDDFSTPNGKAKFKPLQYRPPAETADEEYPFILSTGRSIYHYHTSTMTGATDGLRELYGKDNVDMNPQDAEKLDIDDMELVKVSSRRGEIRANVRITDQVPEGVVFMTFHFDSEPTNILTSPAMDPLSHTPEFKVCAVKVEKE